MLRISCNITHLMQFEEYERMMLIYISSLQLNILHFLHNTISFTAQDDLLSCISRKYITHTSYI